MNANELREAVTLRFVNIVRASSGRPTLALLSGCDEDVEMGMGYYRELADAAIAIILDAAVEEANDLLLEPPMQPMDMAYCDGITDSIAAISALRPESGEGKQ